MSTFQQFKRNWRYTLKLLLWNEIDELIFLFLFQSKYITECLDEIKQELKQENMGIKANAILKLSYVSVDRYITSFSQQVML